MNETDREIQARAKGEKERQRQRENERDRKRREILELGCPTVLNLKK